MEIFNRLRIIFFLLSTLLSAQSEMPIMAFHSFTPQTSTLANFKKFKEAGFNLNHTIFKNNEQVQTALDLAQKVGIKMVIYSDELITNTEATVKRFKNHPALYGYFVADEPSPGDFSKLNSLITKIKLLDPQSVVYVNLFPNYASEESLGRLSYQNYVDEFSKKVDVEFLSFDNYPIIDNNLRNNWYENLEIVRKTSIDIKKPFWAFACSTIHSVYRKPTIGGLKLQQFSNLLYGAKGIQYFTYITMDDEYWKIHNYGYSIVFNNGTPTPTYNLVKQLNQQVKNLSWIFLKSKTDSIFHFGDAIPLGTKKMNFIPEKFKIFKTFGKSALVSFMSSGARKFVIIQNKDIYKPLAFNYQLISGVSIVDSKSGKLKKASTKETIYNIPPGDILIFTYL